MTDKSTLAEIQNKPKSIVIENEGVSKLSYS